jgi:serine protease Do
LRPATLGDSSALEVGTWVMAFGSPFGLKRTVSAGIVSAVGRGHVGISDIEDFIQTDAAINPGNSGGPLVDLQGHVVGISTAILTKSGGYQGVGFAIPINMARQVMGELIAHGKVTRGYLGVLISELNDDLAASFGFTGKGVLVQDVASDGPGGKAGLRPGDIITEKDGKAVADVNQFRNAIADAGPGTTVSLTVFRGGKTQVLKVKLETLPNEETAGEQPQANQGGGTGGSHGMEFVDLTPELRQQLGLENEPGVLITKVQPGSEADDAGLAPGDLLSQVGTTDVKTAQEAERALKKVNPKEAVRLRVIREKRGLFVLLKPRGG